MVLKRCDHPKEARQQWDEMRRFVEEARNKSSNSQTSKNSSEHDTTMTLSRLVASYQAKQNRASELAAMKRPAAAAANKINNPFNNLPHSTSGSSEGMAQTADERVKEFFRKFREHAYNQIFPSSPPASAIPNFNNFAHHWEDPDDSGYEADSENDEMPRHCPELNIAFITSL